MCDLALSVSGGMSPQRDNFSAKTAAPPMPVGDLIMANHRGSPSSSLTGTEHVRRVRLTHEVAFSRSEC
jgi:hypothetical protein